MKDHEPHNAIAKVTINDIARWPVKYLKTKFSDIAIYVATAVICLVPRVALK